MFLALVALFAHPGVAHALIRGPDVLGQLLFTPLVAGWSIWAAIAISTRVSEVRVAQQLATLVSLPSIAVTTLIAVDVIHPTPALAVVLAAVLLVANVLGWRVVTSLFDRERLITGVGS